MMKKVLFALLLLLSLPLYADESTRLYLEGRDLASRKSYDEAIDLFKKSIEISPNYSLPHYGLGRAYLYKEDKSSDAVKELRLAVKFDSRFARGYFYLGLALMFEKKYCEANAAFMKSYQLDSGNRDALYNIAVVYDMLGKDYERDLYYRRYYKGAISEFAPFGF